MRIKKSKISKEINICLCVFFCLLLAFSIWSVFSPQKWDFAILITLMLILFGLYQLINLEWEINSSGIACYVFFGKIKAKTYSWSDFSYIGDLLVVGKGRTLTKKMIVCAEKKPFKKYSNSSAYTLHGHYLSFESTKENQKLFSPYFKTPF